MLSLIPRFEPARESSLSFMVDHVLATFGGEGSANAVGARGIDLDATAAWLRGARSRRPSRAWCSPPRSRSTSACAASSALDLRFDSLPGSALFVTGGFKTRHAELTLEDLLARLEHRLGDRAERRGAGVRHDRAHQPGVHPRAPRRRHRSLRLPALDARPRARSATRSRRRPPGETGLLALFDLANLGSVLHLLTEDLARVRGRRVPPARARLGRRAARLLAHRGGARPSRR